MNRPPMERRPVVGVIMLVTAPGLLCLACAALVWLARWIG